MVKSVTCWTDQISKANAYRCSISKKGICKTSVNHENFNILTCVYMWVRAMKKLNFNLIEEEHSSQCLKISSQYTVKKM